MYPDKNEIEIWKDIEGYKNLYQISSFGRVKSLSRQMFNGLTHFTSKEKILQPSINSINGYSQITLNKNNKTKTYRIHTLVGLAFVPNPENKPEINHINEDGNKQNNYYRNLQWSTRAENNLHKCKILKKNIGSTHSRSKLTEGQVLDILELYNSGLYTQAQLADQFGVTVSNISFITCRKGWKHLNGN